jgi:predicted amidohydrolase
MRRLKAGTVQFQHREGDKEYNFSRIEHFVGKGAEEGLDLLVFPEMCITGYWHVRRLPKEEVESLSEAVPAGPSSQRLMKMSRETSMTLGAGLIEAGEDGNLYNTYLVAMPDGRTEKHRKLHCFISEHMASGSRYTVFDIPQGAKVGVLICYDNNIGENVRATALLGAEVLLAPHQTGGCDSVSPRCMGLIDPKLWENRKAEPKKIELEFLGPKGREWLMKWLPARAHDNGLFLLFSNGVGLDDGEVRTGNAMLLDPYGDLLAETWAAEDTMVTAELRPEVLEMCTGSRWIQSRRPDLYGLLCKPTGRERDTRSLRFEGEKA